MAYDALAESLALIGSREPVRVERLSRRRRTAAMSVDVDERAGLAVTAFARRGVGCTWYDTHVLVRRRAQWVLLGGGGGTGDEDLLADRPQVLEQWSDVGPVAADGRSLLLTGSGGGVHDPGAGRWPGSGRWVSVSEVRAGAGVAALTVAERSLPVPWHGRVALVWTGRRGPRVLAHDHGGRTVDEVVLSS